MNEKTTVDQSEIAKFSEHATEWWNREGPLKTLHDINPVRFQFVSNHYAIEGKRVLDLGCGGGIFSEALAKAGAQVTGVDAESEAIKAARAHAQKNKLNIQYEHTSIEQFESEPFDSITCMEMLEHVASPQLVLEHIARLTKPGGYVFLSTINRTLAAYAGAILAAEYVLKLLPRQTHDYNKFIKPHELAAMARKVGLGNVAISGLAYNPITRSASLKASVSVNYLLAFRKA